MDEEDNLINKELDQNYNIRSLGLPFNKQNKTVILYFLDQIHFQLVGFFNGLQGAVLAPDREREMNDVVESGEMNRPSVCLQNLRPQHVLQSLIILLFDQTISKIIFNLVHLN